VVLHGFGALVFQHTHQVMSGVGQTPLAYQQLGEQDVTSPDDVERSSALAPGGGSMHFQSPRLALAATAFFILACGAGPERGKGEVPSKDKRQKSAEPRSDKGTLGGRTEVGKKGLACEGGFTLFEIHDAQARNAVCNSGESARMHVRPGSGAHKDDWLIYFKGGGSCWSEESCATRWEEDRVLMRTPDPQQLRTDGLFSNSAKKNPDFHDWNVVFVWSCTSDQWMGNRGASDATGGFHFRGAAVVDAVVEDLLKRPPGGLPSLEDAGTLIVAGASAGTGAVRAHGDSIAKTVGADRTFLLHDSGIEPNVVPGFDDVLAKVYRDRYAYWKAEPNDACVAAEKDPATCMDNMVIVTKYLKHPVFANMDQLDGKATKRQELERGSKDEDKLARAVRDVLLTDAFAGAYSLRRRSHTLVTTDTFFEPIAKTKAGDKISMAEALANLVYDREGPTKAVVK